MDDLQSILASTNHWSKVYPEVARHVFSYLNTLEPGIILSTRELADNLLGDLYVTPARNRLYKALKALAKHELEDCVMLGPQATKKIYGKLTVYRPRLWKKPWRE